MSNSIIPGSIGAIATATGKSIAETFVNADLVVIVDTSGSMSIEDSRGGRSRYSVACEELANLQASHPGKIAVLAFSDTTIFCPNGKPVYLGGTTDMAESLRFAKIADVPGMQFVLISDGEPNDPNETLRVAKTYQNKISTIYVGPEDRPAGRDFLQKLSREAGGQFVTADRAKELKASIEKLYLPGN